MPRFTPTKIGLSNLRVLLPGDKKRPETPNEEHDREVEELDRRLSRVEKVIEVIGTEVEMHRRLLQGREQGA